jgi:hypothetical protein
MITTTNYIEKTEDIDFAELPEHFEKGHDFVIKATQNGTNWIPYEKSEGIKRTIDSYLEKLNNHLTQTGKEVHAPNKVEKKATLTRTRNIPVVAAKPKLQQQQEDEDNFTFVERIPDEIRFMRRYLSLNNKRKTKEDLLRFINSLQRSMLEKKIRKSSPYSKQILYIQDKLISTYNEMPKSQLMQVSDKVLNEFKALINSEKVIPAIQFIKRYITLNGRYDVKDKAQKLISAIRKAIEKKKLPKSDRYSALVTGQIFKNLNTYITSKSQKVLSIEQTELNGLNNVLSGLGYGSNGTSTFNGLDGVEESPTMTNDNCKIISGRDFARMQFETIGFKDKWLRFIGDPCPGFSAAVSAMPKMGKSYLCMDFAGYLAKNHGRVLYVSKEEFMSPTLALKVKDKNAASDDMDLSGTLPIDLSPYQFVFFDSVTSLRLSSDDLLALKAKYPSISFINIFQVNKAGAARGTNEYIHNVDVVIQIPEKGKAIQFGRFNQGGEMQIFENSGQKMAA